MKFPFPAERVLRSSALLLALPALLLVTLSACDPAPPEPASKEPESVLAQPTEAPKAEVMKVATVPVSPDDPAGGKFSMADATAGLPATGTLTATIETSEGTMTCELFEDKAPITVANFVGLARGLRPFKDKGEWVKRPAYDGTTFHRIVKGFMIQGGDPSGTGAGQPGYVIPDEIWPGARHDKRGQLCMANRGPNTNGQQFFIMDGVARHLDKGYTIFGQCSPDSVIETLSSAKTKGDRAIDPPTIKAITIARKG